MSIILMKHLTTFLNTYLLSNLFCLKVTSSTHFIFELEGLGKKIVELKFHIVI
jgi:hypothetical protein